MEHITTKDAVDMLEKYPNLYATITLHHLLITLDDVAGGMLQPHLFCKPIAKKPIDRDALLKVALEGHPKVMFGSDSAPHPKHAEHSPEVVPKPPNELSDNSLKTKFCVGQVVLSPLKGLIGPFKTFSKIESKFGGFSVPFLSS